MMRIHLFSCMAATLLLAGALPLLSGCGMIADKDNIVIARLDGDAITRGDLYDLIYKMTDKERPRIRNRNDFLRVLNDYIDDEITIPLGRQLAEEGKISVPRELAREVFFQRSGDDAEQYRLMYNMEIPESGQPTELMKVYDLTPSMVRASKDMIEQETDRIMDNLLAQRAVAYLAAQDAQQGKISVTEEEFEQEYQIQKPDLVKKEWVLFRAIRFPASDENAVEEAGAVRKRIDDGEDFDTIFQEYMKKDKNSVIESEIENDPNIDRFKGFWMSVSGLEAGDVVGPVYLPESRQQIQTNTGEVKMQEMGDYYLVLKILEHRPERTMTLEEAKGRLAGPILYTKEMDRLREEHGVEIYEDKLPDPSGYGEDSPDLWDRT